MSDLKHVRDPVTGRCVACEALNRGGGFLDSAFHPDVGGGGFSTGAGLMVQQSQNRPVTPVVFDPSDPNYIRAIRRGSVSLMKGQGVYTHGSGTVGAEPPMLTSRPSFQQQPQQQQQQQPQILLLEASRPAQQPSYRVVQQPQQPPSTRNVILWQQASGRVEPQQQPIALATVASAAVRQQRQPPPQTVLVQPGVATIHGANFYPGQQLQGGRVGGGGGRGPGGCRDSCRACCLACCACCRRPHRGDGVGGGGSGPKRPYWSYEDGDARGHCCKGWLIGLCILLVVLAILAAALAAVFSTEAVAQSSRLSRRYLLVYNDTLCQQQAKSGGTTLAGCGFTQSAVVVADSTFTNPTVIYSAGRRAAESSTVSVVASLTAAAVAGAVSGRLLA